MNQILVTQKLYTLPEVNKKKTRYKIQFIISIILVIALFSYYIYTEYDRNKSEEVSQEILEAMDFEDSTTIAKDVITVSLDDGTEEEDSGVNTDELIEETQKNKSKVTYTSETGTTYQVDSILEIPSLNIKYPVLTESTDELLKISLNKFWGPEPNEVGNYCVVGHNYKSKKMFGKLSQIKDGTEVNLTDVTGRTLTYIVYDRYVVKPDDVACTSQLTNGKKEITLITCTNYGQERLIVKAIEK